PACFLLSIDESRIPDESQGPDAWIPCAQRPTDPAHICEDFDRPGEPPSGDWTPTYQADGGSLDAAPAALSAPRAAGMPLTALPAGVQPYVLANIDTYPQPIATTAVTLTFSSRFASPPWTVDPGVGTDLILEGVEFGPCPADVGAVQAVQIVLEG